MQDTPQQRAERVAAIRALADLLEQDAELPLPQSVVAQYSITHDITDGDRQMVHDLAEHLGIDQAATYVDGASRVNITSERAELHYLVAGEKYGWRAEYVVHGHISKAGEQS